MVPPLRSHILARSTDDVIKRARTCDHAALYFSGFDGPPRGVHFSGTQEAFEVISRLKIKGAFEPRDDQSAYGSHDITSLLPPKFLFRLAGGWCRRLRTSWWLTGRGLKQQPHFTRQSKPADQVFARKRSPSGAGAGQESERMKQLKWGSREQVKND